MKLDCKLNSLSSYPFHMPGHKRQSNLSLPAENIDITEIKDFDNLHSPYGLIKEFEQRIARVFGAGKSIISVNGSTCCVLSAISAVCNRGDKIIVAANCHRSVYNACLLNGLELCIIEPEYNNEFSCFKGVTQQSVDKAISENPDACAAVITSPTYEGYVSNIECEIPLIVDSAHGAHFGFADWLPAASRGDIVIESLHKTLPSLTQTAVIHINNEKYYCNVKKYMDIFETSSPSYILLDSVDKCVDFLENSREAFARYKLLLDNFYTALKSIDAVTLLDNDDPTRIVLSVRGYTGTELAEHLRSYNIEPEGATLKYVILISTVCDSKNGFDLLLDALNNLETGCNNISPPPVPEISKSVSFAESFNETEETLLTDSIGKVCAEFIYAYPPASPVLLPGQTICEKTVEYIKMLYNLGVNVLSDSSLLPLKILTKK
ncbi:MAG: aminotransferase class I/II-fold pyridoxal phosphate-dependent enzyme [Clostridiales bacterium]|nr:aminotransferase class I/II-fold pyridoxal phosphate-dependent enzyme [Clostridiales bacterium]